MDTMIVRWPGRIKPGTVSSLPWYFPDVMPMLAELAGATKHMPVGIDGISIVPTLLSEKAAGTSASSPMESLRTVEARKQKEHEYLFWEHRGTWAARMGNWKAVLGPKKKTKRRQLELYDLSQDVGENNNLVEEHPEIAARMEASMKQAYTEPRPQREPKQAGGRRYR